MMGLPCGEEIMIVGRTMWTQSTSVTDRQTDGRTDRITITDTVQTASHGKKTIKKYAKNGRVACLIYRTYSQNKKLTKTGENNKKPRLALKRLQCEPVQ